MPKKLDPQRSIAGSAVEQLLQLWLGQRHCKRTAGYTAQARRGTPRSVDAPTIGERGGGRERTLLRIPRTDRIEAG